MDVFIEKENKKKSLKFKGNVKKLLSDLKINPETVIVVKDNELVNEEEILSDKNKIRILSVISGG